mgnify:CR=1 FL=1
MNAIELHKLRKAQLSYSDKSPGGATFRGTKEKGNGSLGSDPLGLEEHSHTALRKTCPQENSGQCFSEQFLIGILLHCEPP